MVMLLGMLLRRCVPHAIGGGGLLHWKVTGLPAITFSRMTRSPVFAAPSLFSSRQSSGPALPQRVAPSMRPPTSCSSKAPSPGSTTPLLLASPQTAACARGTLPATRHTAAAPINSRFHIPLLIMCLLSRWFRSFVASGPRSEDRDGAGDAVDRHGLAALELRRRADRTSGHGGLGHARVLARAAAGDRRAGPVGDVGRESPDRTRRRIRRALEDAAAVRTGAGADAGARAAAERSAIAGAEGAGRTTSGARTGAARVGHSDVRAGGIVRTGTIGVDIAAVRRAETRAEVPELRGVGRVVAAVDHGRVAGADARAERRALVEVRREQRSRRDEVRRVGEDGVELGVVVVDDVDALARVEEQAAAHLARVLSARQAGLVLRAVEHDLHLRER